MHGSLYLTPSDPAQLPDPDVVSAVLGRLGIQGALLSEAPQKQVRVAGEEFTRHVIYAGCSPHLRFEPERPHDRAFCHIALLGPYPEPAVVTGENTVNPRCPRCRARLSDWQQQLHTGQLSCPGCGATSAAWEVDWRQHAASGRYLIELRNVFPGEASPSDQLISALQEETGMTWSYAWSGMSPEP